MDPTSVMSEEQRATIDMLMAEIDKTPIEEMTGSGLGANGGTTPPSQVKVMAVILNKGVGTMHLYDKTIWSGSTIVDFSSEIEMDHSALTIHQGVPPADIDGSSGAVIYVGSKVQGGENDSAWVVAWSVPGNGTGNKIYVEAGPVSKYPKTDITTVWKNIQENLKTLGSPTCHPKPDHGVEACALIDPSTSNSTKASAIFIVNNDK